MNLVGPSALLDTTPPPVALLAMSPVLSKVEPWMATGWPSILTVVEYFCGFLPLMPMLGSGVGQNGGGGGGILHMLGKVAVAMPLLPLVTGVFGGLTATLGMAQFLSCQWLRETAGASAFVLRS